VAVRLERCFFIAIFAADSQDERGLFCGDAGKMNVIRLREMGGSFFSPVTESCFRNSFYPIFYIYIPLNYYDE
jgi:hypothetical protein